MATFVRRLVVLKVEDEAKVVPLQPLVQQRRQA